MKISDFLKFDFSLLFSSIILTVFGILFIYSSAITSTGVLTSTEYTRQIIWGSIGLILAIIIALLNYRRIYHFALYLYLITLVLVLYTCINGRVVHGASAWIGIGSFGIQPSEFTKISTIIFLAQFLDSTKRNVSSLFRFIISCVIVFTPMLLILMQPDLGTALVFIPILLVMTLIAGISLRYIVFLLMTIGLSGVLMILPLWQTFIIKTTIPILVLLTDKRFLIIFLFALTIIFVIALFGFRRYKKQYFYWISFFSTIIIIAIIIWYAAQKVLKEYQIMRLIVFLDPNIDPRGSGWNIIQSITAIGSGGFIGKGYLQGTQSHYRFLPQQSTDFIFSIFSEEWGLIGGLLVFLLFLIIVLRLIKIMRTTTDTFGCYIVTGLSAMYIFHFLINVGMTMGIMPITGIPLLFMSYGGSSLITAMIGIGLALSIHTRRFQY
ncbi:rod shape-determining protein RodA [Spirochaetia bacterium]|nr:rod shape-determining protein RodA [Spirochaetia bacterium]GHV21754.1 rod shape-determining protein RodA [Spirochaetia bacterium]